MTICKYSFTLVNINAPSRLVLHGAFFVLYKGLSQSKAATAHQFILLNYSLGVLFHNYGKRILISEYHNVIGKAKY